MLLASGLRLPPLPEPPIPVPPGTVCATSGEPLAHGYPVERVVTDATGEFLDTFHGDVHGWVSDSAARCYTSADPRRGNPCARSVLAFADGTLHSPLIAREAARAQNRACWSQLVRDVWPDRAGQVMLAIITTDTKKRLWMHARTGVLGERTPIFCYDPETALHGIRYISWPRLITCLDCVEEIYSAGFPKQALRVSLYTAGKIAQTVGLSTTRRMEAALSAWRSSQEFAIALLMAQREETCRLPLL